MDQKARERKAFLKGATSMIAIIFIVTLIAVGIHLYKVFGPFDPEHYVTVLENEGLANVHITRKDGSESQEGSYTFEAVVRSNPTCRITGFGVHNLDYVWMHLERYEQGWYEIDRTNYVSHNWPPDYVTVGQVAAEHPVICQPS